MTQSEFDRILTEEAGQLPPQAFVVAAAIPWQSAMHKIMWGMVLNTFKLEFLYLQYILPLLGSVLMYLGYRSLRRENAPFRLCYLISAFLLVWHAVMDILAATPLHQTITASPLNTPLVILSSGLNFVLLFALRAGIRLAFAREGEPKPKDWLGRGIVAHMFSYAIAVWSFLVPLTEPAPMFGPQIIDGWEWLHYGRSIAFIALEIFLLVCIGKQTSALAGRGYAITPVSVKFSAWTILLVVFGCVALCIPPAAYVGSHIPMPPAQLLTQELTAAQQQSRDALISLGLPEGLADILSPAELEACAGAIAVHEPLVLDSMIRGEERLDGRNFSVTALGELELRLSAWMVVLPGQQARQYQWFEYTKLPDVRLQEQFNIDPSGNYPQSDFAARLVWTEGDTTYFCAPDLQLAGGLTEADIDEIGWSGVMFPDSVRMELERLGGRLHYSPWFDFSIPKQAQSMEGYVAFTTDLSSFYKLKAEKGYSYHDFFYFALRHQTTSLHYPFRDISDLGGTAHTADYGPIKAIYGACTFDSCL